MYFKRAMCGDAGFKYTRDRLLGLRLANHEQLSNDIRRRINFLFYPATRCSYRGGRAGRRKQQLKLVPPAEEAADSPRLATTGYISKQREDTPTIVEAYSTGCLSRSTTAEMGSTGLTQAPIPVLSTKLQRRRPARTGRIPVLINCSNSSYVDHSQQKDRVFNDYLSVIVLNAHSLVKHNAFQMLTAEISSVQPDLVCICETWFRVGTVSSFSIWTVILVTDLTAREGLREVSACLPNMTCERRN